MTFKVFPQWLVGTRCRPAALSARNILILLPKASNSDKRGQA
jgi:hypothetical protein